MFAEMFVIGLLHAQEPGIQRRMPARRYTLQNDGTTAEDFMHPAVDRFFMFAWPDKTKQKVRIPAYWRPGFPLPRIVAPPKIEQKYGPILWDTPEEDVPEPLPATHPRNDRAPGEMDRFGTILH